MILIRKKEFDHQPCFFCEGNVKYPNKWDYAKFFTLYHNSVIKDHVYEIKVAVPCCEHCHKKTVPARIFAIIFGILGMVMGTMYFIHSSILAVTILLGIFVGFFIYYITQKIIVFSCEIIYGQDKGLYEIVDIIIKEYGWRQNQISIRRKDISFDEDKFSVFLQEMEEKYNCEILEMDE